MGPYMDSDLQYAAPLDALISPKDEEIPVKPGAVMAPVQPAVQPGLATGPATQTAATSPAAPPPRPAPAAVPATVTPSGNRTGSSPMSWQDYARRGLSGNLSSADRAATGAQQFEQSPTAAQQNAPLIAQRNAAEQPIPYRDPQTGKVLPSAQQYKPGIGTRIIRGVEAMRKGGVFGAVDPASVGATPYGAPNSLYGEQEQARAQEAKNLDQQIAQNTADETAANTRAKTIGGLEKDITSSYDNLTKNANAEQTADEKAAHDQQVADLKNQVAALKQGKMPTTYEGTVVAAHLEKDPQRRQALMDAAAEMRAVELKKFQYAARASGGAGADPTGKRQAMIDQATQQIQNLQDQYQYDSDSNTYVDPNNPRKSYTPSQFTDMKNLISSKLDAALTKAKLRPLGVRFNPRDAGSGNVQVNRNGTSFYVPPQQAAGGGQTPRQGQVVPPQASQNGSFQQYVGAATPQEIQGGRVMQRGNQRIAYRGGAWRDVTTGKVVQ